MPRLTIEQLLLASLGWDTTLNGLLARPLFGYYDREVAYEVLKRETGQDFGYDVRAWRKWLKEHPLDVTKLIHKQKKDDTE